MIVSRASEELRIVSTKSAVSRSRSFCSRRLVIPTMAFIGVRISWLMLARKSFLARLAASAATTISFSLVMSIEAPISRDGLPSTNCTCAVLRRHRIAPGSGTMRNSTEYGSPVANARSAPLASSQRSSGMHDLPDLVHVSPDVGIRHAFERGPGLRPFDDAGGEIHLPDAEGRRHFGKPHPLSAAVQPFEHFLFGGDVHDRAADSLRHVPGQLDVPVVPVPAHRPIGKHPSKLVGVGPALGERPLTSRLGRGTILGVNGGVELVDRQLHRLVPEPVDACRAFRQRKELGGGIPRPCAETRTLFGQPDAILENAGTPALESVPLPWRPPSGAGCVPSRPRTQPSIPVKATGARASPFFLIGGRAGVFSRASTSRFRTYTRDA